MCLSLSTAKHHHKKLVVFNMQAYCSYCETGMLIKIGQSLKAGYISLKKLFIHTHTKDAMFMLHLQLNCTSSDLTIFFLHKQPLSLITSYSLLSSTPRRVKVFSTTASRCSIVTLSGGLNVWITVSWGQTT